MDTSVINIAFDAMGSDKGEAEMIAGVKLAFDRKAEMPRVTLVGDEAKLKKLVDLNGLGRNPKISIVHASEVVGMDEKPIQSLKQKKDASMFVALDMVKRGDAHAVLSCGNTGSLMAGGTVKLRPMVGIERPALSSVVPSKDHHFIVIDVGANPDSTPMHLVHNAIMGSHHCNIELGVKRPSVGLLTIGTEEGKGTERISETHEHLKQLGDIINYTGLIEGFHVFDKEIDVVVCDGFVGNILIKTCESLFRKMKLVIEEELKKNMMRKVGAGLAFGAFRSIKRRFDPDVHGAAPLLGINGTVLKSHGSSNRNTIMHSLWTASKLVHQDMNKHIQSDIEAANKILKQQTQQPQSTQ